MMCYGCFYSKYYDVKYYYKIIKLNFLLNKEFFLLLIIKQIKVYLLFTSSYQSKQFLLYVISTGVKRNGEISYFCFSKSKCIADTSTTVNKSIPQKKTVFAVFIFQYRNSKKYCPRYFRKYFLR